MWCSSPSPPHDSTVPPSNQTLRDLHTPLKNTYFPLGLPFNRTDRELHYLDDHNEWFKSPHLAAKEFTPFTDRVALAYETIALNKLLVVYHLSTLPKGHIRKTGLQKRC